MKTRQLFLIAISAALGLFGVGPAWAQQGDSTHLANYIRIESITKSAADLLSLPLPAGTKIYFDVRLTDTASAAERWEFVGNSTDTSSVNGARPYLMLNVPLRGVSDKGLVEGSAQLAEGEALTETTNTAAAFYVGQGANAQTLRFAYTVRPGDMTEAITWERGTDGDPRFGGNIGAIQLTYRDANGASPNQPTVLLMESVLKGASGAVAEDSANVWPVNGYVFTVGDGGDDMNTGAFYQGLVPVTISTTGNAAVSTFTNSSLASQFGLWVEVYDEDTDSWKHVPAGITRMTSEAATITQGAFGTDPSDAFNSLYFGRTNGPTDSSAETFTSQKFFVNVPASIPADSTIRLCYGVRKDNATTQTTFATQEFTLQETPFETAAALLGDYSVTCADLEAGQFTLPNSGLVDDTLNGASVNGGTINAGAGETTVLQIRKSGIDGLANYGTLYAAIEQISVANGALATFARRYVPMNPDPAAETYTVNLSIGESAANGETYYRIWVPQLETLTGGTGSVDNPYYLKVVSSPKRETITFVPGETGTLGLEYYQPLPTTEDGATGQSSFLEYTLTVASAEPSTRYFLIYPVDRTGAIRIDPAATFVGRTDSADQPVNAFEAISQYVVLQNQAGSIVNSATAQLVVTLPANQTSATFYVALRNDYPENYLNGEVTVTGQIDPVELQGVTFVAKGCNSAGTITGTNDECTTVVAPFVQNRAPTFTANSAPTTGATGTRLTFTYSVADVASDYLIAQLNFGDGNIESRLYVDEEAMIDLMGQDAWASERALILSQYGITDAVGDVTAGGSGVYPRSAFGAESMTFFHTYNSGSNPSWVMTVTDSSRQQTSVSGQISLTTSQRFTFYTLYDSTIPGTGYVLWDNSTSDDPIDAGWSFAESYTYNALTKDGGTSVFVTAYPFSAGDETPAGYYEVSDTHDSFFYKWAADNQDYANLLPTGSALYDPSLSINRAFVAGGGEAQSSADWQDITLRAIFVAEYLPGDAYQSFTRSRTSPYLYNLGDYNQDGVPDGWLLSAGGDSDGTRALIEGSSQANTAATDDNLPSPGWGGGDAAYRFGASDGRLGYSDPDGPSAATGAAFGYRLRARGRDEALNAADGQGAWLSNPQWVALIRPEQAKGVVRVGNLANGVLTPAWNQVRLNTSGQSAQGVTIAFTAANRVPYSTAAGDGDWKYVVDADGYAIDGDNARYQANRLMVNTNPDSADYEAFRLTYDAWGYTIDGAWDAEESEQGTGGASFPFAMAQEAQDVMNGNVDAWTGGVRNGTFYFVDARAVAGMLIDEPFLTDEAHLTDGFLDPRKTSWLSRFSSLESADQDRDGLNNGLEYFFWYYASRIAYGSVFTATVNGVQRQQLNTALWPAIDLRRRAGANSGDAFTMGRRYRNAYNPDAANNSFYAANGGAGNASAGRGNYWEPIPVADILAAFHPFVAGDPNADPDNDGLTIREELAIGTNPIDCDTDNDWMPDGWETAFELDPLNLNPLNNPRNDNDAEQNPDYDYFATAQVVPYPDYHHLFKVDSFGAGVTVPAGESAYYDYEGDAFYTVASDADLSNLKVAGGVEDPDRVYTYVTALNADLDDVAAWASDEAIFLEMAAQPIRIRDFAVYQAFGFNPMTGWGVPTSNIPSTEKYSGFVAVNTADFVSREEFNSAVTRANGGNIDSVISVSSSPVSADTNSDGIPDGWAAYVGLRPQTLNDRPQDGARDHDADGLTAAREFQCRLANLVGTAPNHNWPASLINTIHDPGVAGNWANKLYPTDPWNMDTDLDGVYDGSEGSSAYLYGTPSDSSWVGGGCNPTSIDTDSDGMTDGWEFRYGIASTVSATLPEEDAEIPEEDRPSYDTTGDGQYIIPSGAPDPTTASDWGRDYDRDGLPNYQEYLTGILRHLRYDLGPDAARLYKDDLGQLASSDVSSLGMAWSRLPDVYSILEDMANPSETYSVDYAFYAPANDGADPEPITVDPLLQALASSGTRVADSTTSDLVMAQGSLSTPGIVAAFNRLWNTSIIFPTEAQTGDYALNVIPASLFDVVPGDDPDDAPVLRYSDAYLAYQTVKRLQTAIVELDAAYQRLITNAVTEGPNPMVAVYTDQALCTRQVLAQMWRIDALLDRLGDLSANLQPVVRDLVSSQTPNLWAARKNQMLKFMAEELFITADEAYAAMAAIGAGADGDVNYSGTDPMVADAEAAQETEYEAYEAAVTDDASTNPLIWNQYRAALRGYNGGIRIDGSRSYLAPIGYHFQIRPFLSFVNDGTAVQGRQGLSELVLGVPALNWTGSRSIGPALPQVTTDRDSFMTTSPLAADTDVDGMDDYWEVFHGLNPLLGDYVNGAGSNGDSTQRNNYTVDKVATIYSNMGTLSSGSTTSIGLIAADGSAVWGTALSPTGYNAFGNPALASGSVTGYDYYSYPWLTGVPFADPDGDSQLNSEEGINPANTAQAYGTDPSPLWMTDPSNLNSFVARFYARLNANAAEPVPMDDDFFEGLTVSPALYRPTTGFSYVVRIIPTVSPGVTESVLPYEINEGFDTDGDGIADLTELTHTTLFSGDPQTLRTPERQQSAYFGGRGAMQSLADTQFGPMALHTFTIELWVRPDAEQGSDEVILVDRPWRFSEESDYSLASVRHNFRVGLRKAADGAFTPFANYTSSGTVTSGGAGDVPEASPTVTAGTTIGAEEWTHLAVVYDGTRLSIYVNGSENGSVNSALIPANGVISVKNDGVDEVQRFSYRQAPLMVGAEPADGWFASLGVEDDRDFTEIFRNTFRGYIDELRIWNGVRTASQIASNRERTLTQSELLAQRVSIFTTRLNGEGYYEPDIPAELLAMYTFNDLLGGSRTQSGMDEETGEPIYTIDEMPWETYPGEKLIGDAYVPGSFLFRRRGLETTRLANLPYLRSATALPSEDELFTSYYETQVAEALRSLKYTEHEFVPMAHSFVAHLPVADVERRYPNLLVPLNTVSGSPALRLPSGSAANLKPADSVYWTPHGAGVVSNATSTLNVKTEGNPYGYGYTSTIAFDVPSHTTRSGYSTYVSPDLLLYGDTYARYIEAGWDDSPSTDPSAGGNEDEKPGAGDGENGLDWFEHFGDDTVSDGLGEKEHSNGSNWLEDNVALGQTKDTDGDLMPNWWENYYGLDPEDPTGVNGPHGDPDGDYLTNYAEYLASSDPSVYSTAGNGVPDYHIPIWARRGRPTFGLLYTDNDFMEDHWEASNRVETLSVDTHDAQQDSDNDGWSNWAEARANFRAGNHSTDPNRGSSASQTGAVVREHPTPAFRLTVDYFGDQNVYTNATAESSIVVHAYSATNNNSAPDATFELPLAVDASSEGTLNTLSQQIGNWRLGVTSGYLHMGNIVPGSFRLRYTRYITNVADDGSEAQETVYFDVLGDTASSGGVSTLYALVPVNYIGEDGTIVGDGYTRVEVGTINYGTGYYTMTFAADDPNYDWTSGGYAETSQGILTFRREEFVGEVSYRYAIEPGQTNTFTLVTPSSGYIREGVNNFYVFADLDGDGVWDSGEPAGIPDQHDVDFGFDQVNRTLHVTLTEVAPPGSVRFDVGSILTTLKNELGAIEGSDGNESSTIPNPVTGGYLKPSNFSLIFDGTPYILKLAQHELIGGSTETSVPGTVVFSKTYNVQKPYLSEDEIFADRPEGLPHAGSDRLIAASYLVYLIPENQDGNGTDGWDEYAIGVVTNYVGRMDNDSTELLSPVGGAVRHNSELTFEWLSNVQVPTITLSITKTEDALGNTVSQRVYERTVRGVTPYAQARGNGDVVQYRYRYTLPRGIGELNADGTALFGDGLYSYTLTLNPYNGDSRTFTSSFRLQLRASGDKALAETINAKGEPVVPSFGTQDSYYLRARINYAGVLKDTADFDGGNGKLVVEAHYSGSFNGDPIASTSDLLCYDDESAETAALNRTVTMSKTATYGKKLSPEDEGETQLFWVTQFAVELRGLPTDDPVYLVAYLDLNQNGKRDGWEPWGYLTQGTESTTGFYFDPRAITPVRTGTAWSAEFYIQDVDTDNDKLADAWEWKNAGMPTGDFSEWCNEFVGTVADHTGSAIWTKDVNGKLALTAYGAQLYGLSVVDGPDANGAVKVDGMPEDLEEARSLMNLLGDDTALYLFGKGYESFGLTVTGVDVTPEGQVTLTWDVTAATGVQDGATYDVTGYFSGAASHAIYAVYGKADLGDATWVKLGDVEASGALTPSLNLGADACVITGEDGTQRKATFFKVIFSAKKDAAATRD